MFSNMVGLVLMALGSALAQQSVYGQCGGTGWTGATTCASGSSCIVLNAYYSQCLPSTSSATTMVTTSSICVITSTITSSVVTPVPPLTISPTKTTGTGAPSTTISGGAGPGATLQSGYYWIRSVESPYYHYYLQTDPEDVPGIAVMGNYTSASQFNIVNGQFVELIDTAGTLLYANVGEAANATSTVLPVSFSTTPNTNGNFSYSGDTVEWNSPSITRPNAAAWYVCTGNQLFINLGQYLYGTPANCIDETIHSYGGSTATD